MAAAQDDVGQSSRQREQFAYDVFLSFRGEDIRKSFIDHLLRALTQRGIMVFYDDKSLERGSEVSDNYILTRSEDLVFDNLHLLHNASLYKHKLFCPTDWTMGSREEFAYDVFLSFRGEDVRKSFIDHLRSALNQKGITVFYDDTGLERGEEIQLKLYEAIESSKIAIVTFSSKYAESRWCLDELVKIMERRSLGLKVLPVFYDIDPTDVRHQTGLYEKAFHKHEVKFGGEIDRVNNWREALTSAANLAGFGLQNQANGYEAQFIQHIVKEVERKLDERQLAIPKYMVRADSLFILGINKWLQNGSSQVEVGIIFGPGGVGKTTIAKVVYYENYRTFESSSFLADVRTALGNETEFTRLQKQLIRNITGNEEIKIDSVHDGKQKIKKAIGTKKILVVFDDINEEVELDKMFECSDWFFPGSKILITTRNRHLLRNDKSVMARFESSVLDEKCSMELFSYHAFGQPTHRKDYTNILMQFVKYCGGLPLALEVSAASLRSLSSRMWGEEFARLKEYSDEKVNSVLKWSFDSLQHSTVKDIFLHIAFYMLGMKRESALWILDGCGLHGKIGLENLIGKCLVSVCKYSDTLMMHQLIQQMGYEVVREESPIELGRRSRLLSQKDNAYNVLWKKLVTSAVKGLSLNIPNALDNDISSDESYAVHFAKRVHMTYAPTNPSRQVPQKFRSIKTDAFTKMNNLDLLLLENVKLEGDFEEFPKGIKWLLWVGCPLKEIPLNFYFDELVVLDMQKSCLVHAWSGSKYIGALKALNLSHSHYLRSTPDLSSAHMLEWISCEDCTSLIEVHESMGKLEYLTYLNLGGCINLVTLPEFNGNFKKVITRFLVKGCISLRNLPINRLGYVEWLDLDRCRSLFKSSNQVEPSAATVLENNSNTCLPLPFNIFLPSLKKLSLTNCGISGDDFLDMISLAPSLESLDLSKNPIGVIMSNKNRRPCLKLKYLSLQNCGISRFDDMGMMSLAPSLENLDLSNNPIQVMGNMSWGAYPKLKYLFLNNCPYLQSISNILKDCWLEAQRSHSLKTITYYYKGRRSIKEKQRHLIDLEYGISATIERISEMNEDRASYLGFPNLSTFDCAGMDCGFFGRHGKYQAGMYIVRLRGNHMAEWFPTMTIFRTKSLRYRVPSFHPNKKWSIRALNVGLWGANNFRSLTVKNVSKKWAWLYCLPSREAPNDENNTWLTHWCVTEHRRIRPGDELEIYTLQMRSEWVYIGVKVMYEEEIDGKEAETDKGNDDSATAGLESLHDDGLNDEDSDSSSCKFMSSTNISISQDEEGSATNTDVAVWYNNAFHSTDLSLFYHKEAELWGDSCRLYEIDYPLNLPYSDDECITKDSDDESSMD